MTQVHYIRKLFFDKGKTIKEIERATGHNYRTIRKYIDQKDFNEPPKKARRENKSDYLRPHIRACLKEFANLRQKHQLYKAEAIHRYLREEKEIEITISKRRFRTLVAEEKQALRGGDEVYIDLTHPGGEAQVDFGEVILYEAGRPVKKHELVLSFPFSNAGYVQITESEQSEALFEALTNIFNHIGKVPKKIWFDQMSTAALRRKDEHGQVKMSERLARFSAHYGFESVFCNPHSGHEKGSVENKVGYYRRNFINTDRTLRDLDRVNRRLLKRCDEDHRRGHYQKKEAIETLFEREKASMRTLNRIPIDMRRLEVRAVDKYGHISFEGNRYSVHPTLVNTTVHLSIGARKITILNGDTRTIAEHPRDYHKGRTHTHWKDFIDPIIKRPRALKYSGIYQLLPASWQAHLNRLPNDALKAHLAFLKHCLIHHDLNTADKVLKSTGMKDAEALWTTLYRLNEDRTLYEGVTAMPDALKMPAYQTDLNPYDTFIQGASDER